MTIGYSILGGLLAAIWCRLGGTAHLRCTRQQADELYQACIEHGCRWHAGQVLDACASATGDTVLVSYNKLAAARWHQQRTQSAWLKSSK